MNVEVDVVSCRFRNSRYGNRNGSLVPSHVYLSKMSKNKSHFIHCKERDRIILLFFKQRL